MKDKKTLSQKGLKLAEEVGELAKVILPYDSAHGTNHRFIDKERILEEVVDVYLTNISIAHSIGITDEEFDEMLNRKSLKWAELQSKESNATFPLPFEIHITVTAGDLSDDNIEQFKKACSIIEVKPIILDLEINGQQPIKDIMTSSKHFGDNKSAYLECERIVFELGLHGYKVVRKKIESVPWHMKAPNILDGVIPDGCYFECHIGVSITSDEKKHLDDFVKKSLCHLSGTTRLSQNFFKKSKEGKYINILTYRNNSCGKYKFEADVDQIKSLLNSSCFVYEKVEIEFAVYDTNVNHDAKWIKG